LGCTGQDGSLLSNFLLNKNYKVVGVARRTSSPTDWRLRELNIINHPYFILCSGDLTDQGSLERIFKKYQPDEIYNLAAQSFVGASWDCSLQTCDVTGLGAVRVFDAARNICPKAKIYQASSSEMFGGSDRREVLDEDSIFDPQSPYGAAKVFAHQMANVYRKSFNMFISCGILMNHESEYRGEQFVTRKVTKAVAEIKLGLRGKLNLHNLDSMRDWGYAGDFINAMYLMLQQSYPDDYVIATGKIHSISDLCRIAFGGADINNWEDYIELKGGRLADVKYLLGSYEKANHVLGWSPTVSFKDMIKIMVDKDIERIRGNNGSIS
jgi:GDPmannose 4,6-dehydratase